MTSPLRLLFAVVAIAALGLATAAGVPTDSSRPVDFNCNATAPAVFQADPVKGFSANTISILKDTGGSTAEQTALQCWARIQAFNNNPTAPNAALLLEPFTTYYGTSNNAVFHVLGLLSLMSFIPPLVRHFAQWVYLFTQGWHAGGDDDGWKKRFASKMEQYRWWMMIIGGAQWAMGWITIGLTSGLPTDAHNVIYNQYNALGLSFIAINAWNGVHGAATVYEFMPVIKGNKAGSRTKKTMIQAGEDGRATVFKIEGMRKAICVLFLAVVGFLSQMHGGSILGTRSGFLYAGSLMVFLAALWEPIFSMLDIHRAVPMAGARFEIKQDDKDAFSKHWVAKQMMQLTIWLGFLFIIFGFSVVPYGDDDWLCEYMRLAEQNGGLWIWPMSLMAIGWLLQLILFAMLASIGWRHNGWITGEVSDDNSEETSQALKSDAAKRAGSAIPFGAESSLGGGGKSRSKGKKSFGYGVSSY